MNLDKNRNPTQVSWRWVLMTPFSPTPGVVMEESGAPTTDLTLWLPELGLGPGVGRAGLSRPGKAEVKVLSEIVNNALAVKLLEGDDTARWQQWWLRKQGLVYGPMCPLFKTSSHRVQQHGYKDLPGLVIECHVKYTLCIFKFLPTYTFYVWTLLLFASILSSIHSSCLGDFSNFGTKGTCMLLIVEGIILVCT